MIKHFERNLQGNDYAVGDIHGMFTVLEKNLEVINFNPSVDRLFSVGDLVDRGPESNEVLDWLAKPWSHSVLGNHEQMIIDAYRNPTGLNILVSSQNGGAWFFDLEPWVQLGYVEAFESLPLAIEIETSDGLVGVIHAEVFDWDWDKLKQTNSRYNVKEEALWSRTKIKYKYQNDVKNINKVYCGHTPVEQITQLGNQYYIDTSACRPKDGGYLTIIKI